MSVTTNGPAPAVAAFDRLVAARRRQLTAVVDALGAARDLADVVQREATRRPIETGDDLLDGAPDEETRALWQSLLDRALQPVPDLNGASR